MGPLNIWRKKLLKNVINRLDIAQSHLLRLPLNPWPPASCQVWPPRPRIWSIRWLSCPIMATPSACWLCSPPRRTPLCPGSSRTSAPPQCRVGPNWCTRGKCTCLSPGKTRHALCSEQSSDMTVAVTSVGFCFRRFTAEAKVDLQEPLTALGIRDMFSKDKADFRHLSEWSKVSPSPKVVQCLWVFTADLFPSHASPSSEMKGATSKAL